MSSILFKSADRVFTATDLEGMLANGEIKRGSSNSLIQGSFEASFILDEGQTMHIFSTKRRMKRYALMGAEYTARARRFNTSRPSATLEIYNCLDAKALYGLLEKVYFKQVGE